MFWGDKVEDKSFWKQRYQALFEISVLVICSWVSLTGYVTVQTVRC